MRPRQTLAHARLRSARIRSALLDETALVEAKAVAVAALLALTPRVAGDGPTRFWLEPVGDLDDWSRSVLGRAGPFGGGGLGIGPWAAVAFAAALDVDAALRVVGPAEARAFLDRQSLSALEVSADAAASLGALGIRSGADLRALAPLDLGVRFGPEVAEIRRRLDGDDRRGATTPRLARKGEIEVELEHPLTAIEPLLFLLPAALARLLHRPRTAGRGLTRFSLTLEPERGAPRTVEVRTAEPVADPRTALELLRAHLDAPSAPGDPHDGVVRLRLCALADAPVAEPTGRLWREGTRDPAAQEVALLRLRTRFGAVVHRAEAVASPVPEARARWVGGPPSGRGASLPWRRIDPPVPLVEDAVVLGGTARSVLRVGVVERSFDPWWDSGRYRVSRRRWAELDGSLLVLLRERRGTARSGWEAIAWLD